MDEQQIRELEIEAAKTMGYRWFRVLEKQPYYVFIRENDKCVGYQYEALEEREVPEAFTVSMRFASPFARMSSAILEAFLWLCKKRGIVETWQNGDGNRFYCGPWSDVTQLSRDAYSETFGIAVCRAVIDFGGTPPEAKEG